MVRARNTFLMEIPIKASMSMDFQKDSEITYGTTEANTRENSSKD